MRRIVLLGLILAFTSPLHALEIHFRPSFVELVSDGVSQRVRPGELVEAPVGESVLEMEISEQSPRTVELRARGRCEFVVFGAPSVLEDSGKMTISMDPATKKLDIGWVKGEMKTAPASFDKPSVATFFADGQDDFLRPMDFPGVRPFGYTDALEGRGSMVAEGDWRNLPPLPEPPPRLRGPRRPPPQDYYDDPDMVADWRTFEEEHSELPPLSLPPPTRERRSSSPTQVLMLAPSTPTKSEPPPPPSSQQNPGQEETISGDTASSVDYQSATQSSDIDAEPGDANVQDQPAAASPNPPAPEPSPTPAGVSTPESTHEPSPESSNPTTPDVTEGQSEAPGKEKSVAPPPTSPRTEPAKRPFSPRSGDANPTPSSSSGENQPPSSQKSETTRSAPGSSPRSSRPVQSGPTLYDRIVAQEEKQKEVIELLKEVSKQMQEIKAPPPPPLPTPQPPSASKVHSPASHPKSEEPPAATLAPKVASVPPPPPRSTPPPIPPLPRSSSPPKTVQPVGSRSAPAPARPLDLSTSTNPPPPPVPPRKVSVEPYRQPGATSASLPSQSDEWDFTLEAVGSQK